MTPQGKQQRLPQSKVVRKRRQPAQKGVAGVGGKEGTCASRRASREKLAQDEKGVGDVAK